MTESVGVRLIILGRVQGVGFRHFIWRRATELGLDGQVRNRPDGSVEVLAWGEPGPLDRLIELARRGPSAADVTEVEVRYDAGARIAGGFRIGT
jgi:acylphosphatase